MITILIALACIPLACIGLWILWQVLKVVVALAALALGVGAIIWVFYAAYAALDGHPTDAKQTVHAVFSQHR